MKPENQQKLIEDHPHLFASGMYFECLDGWFDLLYKLSQEIEPLIIQYKKDCPLNPYIPIAVQVKEKYGTLRFYMYSETDAIGKFIEEAESKSASTCEVCGKEGKVLRNAGWLATRCEECPF